MNRTLLLAPLLLVFGCATADQAEMDALREQIEVIKQRLALEQEKYVLLEKENSALKEKLRERKSSPPSITGVLAEMEEAQVQAAATNARVIRSAVSAWQLAENEYRECPTISQLVEDKQLDASQSLVDPWGQGYTLTCMDDEVIVSSSGADKRKDTGDDIVIPKGARL